MVPINIPPANGRILDCGRRLKMAASTIVIFIIGIALQACTPVKLTHVLVDNRQAEPSEYHLVKIIKGSKSIATKPGMNLSKDSEVETDGRTWAIIEFAPGTRVFLKPNTRVRIASLTVIYGEIVAVIDKLRGIFKVKTEDVEAGPESTVFTVSKKPNGPSKVSVIRGAVQLTSPAQAWPAVTIKQYQRATTLPGAPPRIDRMKSETFNLIVEWTNRVEFAANPAQANVLVPDIQMMLKEKAQQVLKRLGLSIGKVEPRVTDRRPPLGTVVEQSPAPGTRVQRGASINIGVEVEPVQVPRLINKPQSVARQLLAQSGLVVGRLDRRITGSAPAETVIEQQPEPGATVPKGTAVNFVVEEKSVLVPDLRRLNRNAAMTALGNVQLTAGRWDEEITGSQPPHTVLRQHPQPNTRVRPGTAVNLVVEAVSVVVPNLIGRHRNNAAADLSRQQLVLGHVSEQITGRYAAGIIFHQDPAAGRRVKPGTAVRLQVEAVSVVVPNLVGLFRNSANSTLRGRNLRIGSLTEELRENARDGTVLRQVPPPGQRVPLNTPINLTLAVAASRVPHITGQTRSNAESLLKRYGLVVGGIRQRETNNVPVGHVMEQNPRAGILVRRGTPVHIVLATRPSCYVPNIVLSPLIRPIEADRLIRNAGLVPRNRSNDYTERARVNYQYPRPGFKLFCGDTVEYNTVRIVY